MRIDVAGRPGELAERPRDALLGLADAAMCDGADRDAWLAKAISSVKPVKRAPTYRVVADAVDAVLDVYARATTLMVGAVRERLEQAALAADGAMYRRLADPKALAKAGGSGLVTPSVARDVTKIIADYHAAVAAVLWGKEAVSSHEWDLARSLGLTSGDDAEAIAQGLHTFGAFLAHLDQAQQAEQSEKMTLAQFRERVKKNPIPQTASEHRAAVYSATRGAQHIVGLGNKAGAWVGSHLIEADRQLDQQLRSTMRDIVSAKYGDADAAARIRKLGVDKGLPESFFDDQFRMTIARTMSDIGHATGDWTRDIQRIAQTETHNAVQHGMMESWEEQEEQAARNEEREPRSVKVFKLPKPDACKYCIALHLDGDTPRLYDMSALSGHGNNVGRKAGDWQAVVGATHPWCGCSLHRVPAILGVPKGWRSGDAAPDVIGPGGRLVIP